MVESELAARGLIVFSSDTVADDWHHRIGAKQIIAAATRRLEANGKGILLLHDIHPKTVAALPGVLKELKDKGFRIVQVVPAASYVIAMANKPTARIALAMQGEPAASADVDRQVAPRWPDSVAHIAPEDSALPVPDAAAFEPDAVPGEDVADVRWPVETQVMAPPAAKTKASRKHKLARASDKRKQQLVQGGKPERRVDRAHKDRRQRVRANAEGHHADNSPPSRAKAFSALFTPSPAAAH
jgi:hypothetical protein